MATIYRRRHVKKESFGVQIRRKGLPTLSITFNDYHEALQWVWTNEEKYIENPEKYQEWAKKKRMIAKNGDYFTYEIR